MVGSWSNIKSRFVNIKTITIHKKRAIHSISLNFLPISINFLAPYNCAIIGVTEKMTPEMYEDYSDIQVPLFAQVGLTIAAITGATFILKKLSK